jgi:nucleoside phosphorylase
MLKRLGQISLTKLGKIVNDHTSSIATILVFVALPEEHDRFLERFPSLRSIQDSEFVFVEHDIDTDGFRMISVLAAGMGIDNAYDATTAGITRFKPNLVVCIGIAGSLTVDLKIGDVTVSSEIIDISQNIKISEVLPTRKRRPSNRTKAVRPQASRTVVELSPKSFPIRPELSASFRFLRSHPTLKSNLADWVDQAKERRTKLIEGDVSGLVDELTQDPVAEIGPIISGPVVANSAFKDVIKKIDRKVLAVETESSGVCRASAAASVPCVTVRGISDHADVNKNALERTTKLAARRLAADNAISYFALQLCNPSFMRIASSHKQDANEPQLFNYSDGEPDKFLSKISNDIDAYLQKMSPEYKHRPNNASLPIPRVMNDMADDDVEEFSSKRPKPIFEALRDNRNIFLKIPKSYPNQTIAWSIGQALLRSEVDGKQILPLVASGDELTPPSKGIEHATGINPNNPAILQHFAPVLIINEPQFHSQPKMNFLISEIQKYPSCPAIFVSRSESPTDQIDRLKTDLGLIDHSTAPVPFHEIASYLETAFDMNSAEADSVANRLDETFSKFRLHTHPAYFVGLQETTLDALIEANQRAELIQLAVDGLLTFVVAFDESPVKLSRTTREEFLSDLAFEIRVEKRAYTKDNLYSYVREFAERKALEISPEEFLKGYFAVGLLNDASGRISFSVPFLEAYLLSERLRSDPVSAARYFDPHQTEFDQFTFDLYVERGACESVVSAVCAFARSTLAECDENENVYLAKSVRPRALSSSQMLLRLAHQLGEAAVRMAENSGSKEVRDEKQQLLDTRQAVRGKVASRDPMSSDELPEDIKAEFAKLDALSRASTLLATLIGSGAERLDGDVKVEIANLVLKVLERFLHKWTVNRMGVNFEELREELKSDATVDQIIEKFGLYSEEKESIIENLMIFLDDQELRLLSGPGAVLFSRLSQYAGVRSLRPIFTKVKPTGMIQKLFRDTWLMDVEHSDGKKALKDTLQHYKGSPLLRLIITNHLMNRIFWHHWQRESKASFVDVARYSLAPLGLRPADEHTQKMLSGPKR